MEIGSIIMKKRKELGITQQVLAKKLHVSNQAVSKWENGMTCPEISLLPAIAKVFGMSVDSLLGYQSPILSDYEKRYQEKGYYWGIKPNDLCYEILKLKPPIKPLKVLDVGCGEGKDAVFLARNGYHVSAFDLAETGVEKGRALASQHGVYVDFFTGIPADMIKKAISLGVSKINVNTECQLAFADATRKYVEAGKDLEGKGFDPRKLLAPGAEAIKATVKEKMELFGSVGKA